MESRMGTTIAQKQAELARYQQGPPANALTSLNSSFDKEERDLKESLKTATGDFKAFIEDRLAKLPGEREKRLKTEANTYVQLAKQTQRELDQADPNAKPKPKAWQP
jgi:hypothetical protein